MRRCVGDRRMRHLEHRRRIDYAMVRAFQILWRTHLGHSVRSLRRGLSDQAGVRILGT